MQTTHRVVVDDARALSLPDDSVELVVTSPPYPMIELWDDVFRDLDPEVASALDAGDGPAAFRRMHAVLATVWEEIERVLVPGGLACVNIGDATRTVDDTFRCYPNAAAVTQWFTDAGLVPLPPIRWRKPVNRATKFMGSGMLPPNAYVTLEHEHVLVFRNGSQRDFPPGDDRRYESAYFWEERNRWFSDLWEDVGSERQGLADDDLRERTAAFPVELPYRLINMFSVRGDTVLDPFWGTGTTTLAAMCAARHSVGYERDTGFREVFDERVADAPSLADEIVHERLASHEAFVADRVEAGNPPAYQASHYDTRVVTKQERDIRFRTIADVEASPEGYRVTHAPV